MFELGVSGQVKFVVGSTSPLAAFLNHPFLDQPLESPLDYGASARDDVGFGELLWSFEAGVGYLKIQIGFYLLDSIEQGNYRDLHRGSSSRLRLSYNKLQPL